MQILEKNTETCYYCMKMCRFSCPVSEASKFEDHTPFAKMGALFNSDDENTSLAYYCTHCGLCTENCKHSINVESSLAQVKLKFTNLDDKLQKLKSFALAKEKQFLSDTKKVLEKKIINALSKSLLNIAEGDVLFIPDYHHLRENEKFVNATLKQLNNKYENLYVLNEPMASPFYYYTAGEKQSSIDAVLQFQNLLQKNCTLIFQSEEYFYGALKIAKELELEVEHHGIHLLYNILEPTLPEKSIYFHASSLSLRLYPQYYIEKLREQYANIIKATPYGRLQIPLNDSRFFADMFPQIHSQILNNKWIELIDYDEDIVFSDYWQYREMKKQVPKIFTKKIEYLCHKY